MEVCFYNFIYFYIFLHVYINYFFIQNMCSSVAVMLCRVRLNKKKTFSIWCVTYWRRTDTNVRDIATQQKALEPSCLLVANIQSALFCRVCVCRRFPPSFQFVQFVQFFNWHQLCRLYLCQRCTTTTTINRSGLLPIQFLSTHWM